MSVLINAKHDTAGCARCRMDEIRFTRDVKLPRFTMRAGESYNLPQTSYRADGMIALGYGLGPHGSYVVVERDATRASHNGGTCPGTALDRERYSESLPEYIEATRP